MKADSESFESKIKKFYAVLLPSEKKAADYVLLHTHDVSSMSLAQLSTEAGVSEPTIIRFVRKIGCDGFSVFKMGLMKDWGREITSEKPHKLLVDLHIKETDKIEDIPSKIIGLTVKALEDTLKIINTDEYIRSVAMISTSNIIDIYGVGNSGSIAGDFMNKLIRIGLNCRQYSDSHLQQICAGHLTGQDLAIAISHSGSTIDTVKALEIARKSGAKTMAITNYKGRNISRYADVTLYTGDVETMFYSETMASRISQLAIVDMLYMGVLLSNYDLYTKRLDKVNLLVKEKNY